MLGGAIIPVTAWSNDTLTEVFGALRQDPDHAADIPRHISYKGCSFFRMKNPVSLVRDGTSSGIEFHREVIKTCSKEEMRELLHPEITYVRDLASEFSKDFIYLVIELPDGECCRPS